MTNVTIVTPELVNEIITMSRAKKQLRVEASFTEEDDLIADYIDAAVEASEQYIGGHIYKKDMIINLSAFQSTVIFEAYPFRGVTSVKYYKDGVLTVLADAEYYITTQNLKQIQITFKNKPEADDRYDAVEIILGIGYEKATKVPAPIKQAILLQISDMYERREDRAATVSTAAQSLMRPYRKYT